MLSRGPVLAGASEAARSRRSPANQLVLAAFAPDLERSSPSCRLAGPWTVAFRSKNLSPPHVHCARPVSSHRLEAKRD